MAVKPYYLDPGMELAGYRIESMIARGGMGVVYRAFDVQLNRPVALKLLAPELAANDKFRQRFVRESRLAASVDHPNILPIYGAGESSGLLYIAMRYVHGTDLKEELDTRGALPLAEVMRVLSDTASALDAAHEAGLVHRDIKPGNILLSDDQVYGHRHVYLTDFGLTKRASSATGVTTAGHFLGTLDYVAPEQIRGEDVDGRADVYALACVAYALLAGHPPFDYDDDSAQLWAHMTEEPPLLCAERPEVPTAIGLAIQAGMAKDREERPASCGALVDAMDTLRSLSAWEPVAANSVPASSPEAQHAATPRPTKAPSARHRGPVQRRLPVRSAGRARAWILGSLVAVLVLILAAVLVLPQLPSGDERVTFTAKGIPYTLQIPKSWTPRSGAGGDSTVSVLSPGDVTALFADEPDGLESAARTVTQDPASVVGLTIYHQASVLGAQSPSARVSAAEALLPGTDARLVDRGTATLGEVKGQVMEGTLPLSSSVILQVRVCVLETDSSQLLVFFAPSSLFEKNTGIFDKVAGSLHRTK
jgi:serine/threonine protein kinase